MTSGQGAAFAVLDDDEPLDEEPLVEDDEEEDVDEDDDELPLDESEDVEPDEDESELLELAAALFLLPDSERLSVR